MFQHFSLPFRVVLGLIINQMEARIVVVGSIGHEQLFEQAS